MFQMSFTGGISASSGGAKPVLCNPKEPCRQILPDTLGLNYPDQHKYIFQTPIVHMVLVGNKESLDKRSVKHLQNQQIQCD